MALKAKDPTGVLAMRPFVTGMATAFDVYGIRGLQAQESIRKKWHRAMAEPLPSAEKSVEDSIVYVNVAFRRLLIEHSD